MGMAEMRKLGPQFAIHDWTDREKINNEIRVKVKIAYIS
jgi:hypothetical protein